MVMVYRSGVLAVSTGRWKIREYVAKSSLGRTNATRCPKAARRIRYADSQGGHPGFHYKHSIGDCRWADLD